jgi:hypothetical protein
MAGRAARNWEALLTVLDWIGGGMRRSAGTAVGTIYRAPTEEMERKNLSERAPTEELGKE